MLYDRMGAGMPFITGGILVILAASLALPALPAPHEITHKTTVTNTEGTAMKILAEEPSTASKLS
jgi:hypothetical protein